MRDHKHMKTVLKFARILRRACEEEWSQRKWKKAADRPTPEEANLGGWCVLASKTLFLALRARHIPCELRFGSGHCYLVYGDYIVDVTATQFGVKDRVAVVKVEDEATTRNTFWQNYGGVKTVKDLAGWTGGLHGVYGDFFQKQTRRLKRMRSA